MSGIALDTVEALAALQPNAANPFDCGCARHADIRHSPEGKELVVWWTLCHDHEDALYRSATLPPLFQRNDHESRMQLDALDRTVSFLTLLSSFDHEGPTLEYLRRLLRRVGREAGK